MRRPLLLAAALGAMLLGRCALVDAWLGPTLISDDEICDEVRRIWAGCSVDLSSCVDVVDCAREKRTKCSEAWGTWVRCLQDESASCVAAEAGEPFPCAGDYKDYLTCIGDGTLSNGEGMVQGCLDDGPPESCGNGVCEPGNSETPQNCGQDCAPNCAPVEDGGAPAGHCTPFRSGDCPVCTCSGGDGCDPLTENDYSCADCSCDQDGHCDAGESVWGCPGDCACDFDGSCSGDETWLSCSDCDACDDANCAGAESEPCSTGIGCRVPLLCDDHDLRCRMPCQRDGLCPTGRSCSSDLCVP